MIKKIVVIGVLFSFLTQQPLCIWAQSQDAGGVFENMELKAKPVSAQGAYRKFTCPSCSKEFEFQVDPNDTEMRQGTRKVVCPYDGQAFYPGAGTTRQEDLRYEEVRCPDCGKEFRAYIDVKALLAGRSQTLTCPYDSRKFYFKAEGYHPEAFQRADLVTVTCPTDKRTFKAYVDPANARELTCPYDGTRFFPAPEMIVTEIAGVRETSSPNGYGERASPSSMILGQPQQVQATQGVLGTMAPKMQHEEEKPSRVEETFSEHIPLNVSTALKQFGYNIFKPVEKVGRNPEKSNQSADGALKNEGGLLKTLLGGNQQSGFNTGTADTDGDFSPFNSPTEIPMISDYVLGPGDKLRISVWGQLQESFPVTVDAEGKIMLPKIGPLYLWGVKFSDAEQQIKDALGKNYTNIQITVSLAQLRTIKVFVLGEAVRPGAYTISALSNAFNALYAAGGPTKTGSLRKIKLVRKGAADRIIDLYDVLLKGENSQDYKLEGSDTIFVSPIGDVIGVAGNVKRPAIYELNGKAKLADCLAMAGGLSSVAYLQRIQLERVKDHDRKVVLDLEFKSLEDLTNSPNNLDIQDGDLVIVFPITSARYNFVSITGSVLRPGDYELKEGMILKDLIAKAGGVLPGTYLKRAEIARFKGDQMREIIAVDLTELASGSEEGKTLLKEWDVITLYSQRERALESFVEIGGAVNTPGTYELMENMKVSDLIFKAGGLARSAATADAELYRASAQVGSKIVTIDLARILSKEGQGSSEYDFILKEGDYLSIKEDRSKTTRVVVTLAGEFVYPGKYAVEKGTRLGDVIKRAGGFTKDAYPDGCVYARESVKAAQGKMLKNYLDLEQKALLQEQSSMSVGVTSVQAEARNKLIEYRQRLVETLENAEPNGRILIRLGADLAKFEKSEYNIVLDDQDTITLPSIPSTVQVVGNVYGAGMVAFSEGKGIEYYINRTGGLTKYADPNRIFVIRANGETVSSFVRAVKVRRGDVIIVPEEFRYRTPIGLVIRDTMQVLYQATLGAAVSVAAAKGF